MAALLSQRFSTEFGIEARKASNQLQTLFPEMAVMSAAIRYVAVGRPL